MSDRRLGFETNDDWSRFEADTRSRGVRLLACLDRYPRAILVAGCQRSGTRMVADLVAYSGGLGDCGEAQDPELAAARLLAGDTAAHENPRYCFQTTYLDDSYREYLEHDDFHLIWVIRHPAAVVRSMLYNWYRPGFDRLFRHCGRHELAAPSRARFQRYGRFAVSRLTQACMNYNAKMRQLCDLYKSMPGTRLSVIDYDDLVMHAPTMLNRLARRGGFAYRDNAVQRIRSISSSKRRPVLSRHQRYRVARSCSPGYRQALGLCMRPG